MLSSKLPVEGQHRRYFLEEARENFQHSNAVDYACLVAPEQCDSLPSRTKTNARGGQPRQVETQLRQ